MFLIGDWLTRLTVNLYIPLFSIKIILVTRFNSDYVMNSLDCVNETIICLLHVVLGFKNTEVWLVIFLVMIGDPIAICWPIKEIHMAKG